MPIKFIFWSLLLVAVALEVVGDIFFKRWTLEHRPLFLWAGFAIYATGTLLWAFSLKYELLAKAISVFTIVNLICVVLVGILLFDEHISMMSKIGIFLGLISIALIELG